MGVGWWPCGGLVDGKGRGLQGTLGVCQEQGLSQQARPGSQKAVGSMPRAVGSTAGFGVPGDPWCWGLYGGEHESTEAKRQPWEQGRSLGTMALKEEALGAWRREGWSQAVQAWLMGGA